MKTDSKTLLAASGVLLLTTLHHVYGAALYATPWRHHAALVAMPVVPALALAYGIHRRWPGTTLGRAALRLFALLTLAGPVLLFGLVEGGYNHGLKNLLHFGGVSPATFARLFPTPRYEAPNDLWFEVSGVLQLVLGILAARYVVRLWRERRTPTPATGRSRHGGPRSARPAVRPNRGVW